MKYKKAGAVKKPCRLFGSSLLFQAICLFGTRGDIFCTQAILFQQFQRRAGRTKGIVDPHTQHRYRQRFADDLRHRAAQAADDVMLLRRNQRTGIPRRFDKDVAVDRLDGRHVDHPR